MPSTNFIVSNDQEVAQKAINNFVANPNSIKPQGKENDYNATITETAKTDLSEPKAPETPAPVQEQLDDQASKINQELKQKINNITDNLRLDKEPNNVSVSLSEDKTVAISSEDGSVQYFNKLNVIIPKFGIEEFINDRTTWQKQLFSIAGEPGWFYFKIFFDFEKTSGLLGGLLKETPNAKDILGNNAFCYLCQIKDKYTQEQIPHRINALQKFGSTLNSIQLETPWLFKSVNGLDVVNSSNFTEMGKTKEIEIGLNVESADMRLGTLIDLYKYACFDPVNFKEIIPSNLRKFDMYIMVYHTPIRSFQSQITFDKTQNQSNNEEQKKEKRKSINDRIKNKVNNTDLLAFPAKKTYAVNADGDYSNAMSFKLYSFKNCEFKTDTLTVMPNQMSDEQAYNLGNNSIKIMYDRIYEYRMNEWSEFLMGDTGFEFDNKGYYGENINLSGNSMHKKRIDIIRSGNYTEFTDEAITDLHKNLNNLGNIYGYQTLKSATLLAQKMGNLLNL